MVDAMRSILEQRGFEAGAFTVGYQSCDNATAQAGGLDFFRCAANAKAYARNLRVVAVFGSFQSPARMRRSRSRTRPRAGRSRCSARRTRSRVSRPTTASTRRARGASSASRRRDHLEGSAQVELAKQLGHDRVYLPDVGVGGVRRALRGERARSREAPRRRDRRSGRLRSRGRELRGLGARDREEAARGGRDRGRDHPGLGSARAGATRRARSRRSPSSRRTASV